MAVITYPLNNLSFTAEDVGIYNCTRTTGIFAGDDFTATLTGNDNTVTVGAGMAWMRLQKFFGVAVAMKTQTAVDMGLPDTNYPRIDAIILKFDANKNATELTVKKGTAASTPTAPVVTRTEAVHEIHLYQVRREPSATAITASKMTDMRLSATHCGLMADAVSSVDTAAINAQITALIQELEDALQDVEDQTYYASKDYADDAANTAEANAKAYSEQKKIKFTSTSVPTSSFVSDTTYADYPYRAAITLSGVTSSMIPEVTFSVADLVGTEFAPVAECYNGGVYIYAADQPPATVIIPTIICWR